MATIAPLSGKLELDVSAWDRQVRAVQKQADDLGSSIGRAVERAASFAAGQAAFMAFGNGIDAAKQAVFGMNSTLETAELQFTTLMGSADAAKVHVADLFEIAKKTPFETGPIIAASKSLQTFGGAALNTKDNIMLIGDAAAASGAPINELSFWVGRAYSMIQGGQPFGEAAMRLQELAILTPKARQEMEQLQKTGASSAEVWKVLQGELGRFGGAMEKQAGTWAGLTSTFEDSKNILLSKVFQPLFKVAEETLGRINEFLDTDAVETWAATMGAHMSMVIKALGILGSAFGTVFGAIAQLVMSVGQIIYEGMQWINPFARHSDPLVTQVEDGLDLIIAKYKSLSEIEAPLNNVASIVDAFEATSAAAMAKVAQETLDLKMISLSYLGKDIPQAYAAAIGSIQSLNMSLDDMRGQIAAQKMVVQEWKTELDAATEAVRAQQVVVRDAQRELRPFEQAVRAAKLEQQPFADATKLAKDELQTAKDQIADTSLSLKGMEDALTAANRAMSTQALNVETAKSALAPFKDSIDDADAALHKLSDQLAIVKGKISDLQNIPLEGSGKFKKQLEDTEDAANAVRLRIAQMAQSGVKSGPAIDGLRSQLEKLQAKAETVRLQEAVELGPKRRQISEALQPKPTEQSFASLIGPATDLGKQSSGLEALLKTGKEGLNDLKTAADPYIESLKNEEKILRPLVTARDMANNALQRAKDQLLTPLIDLQGQLEQKVRQTEAIERPYAKATEEANRQLQARKDEMQPLIDQLADLRDIESDIRDGYDVEAKTLSELNGAYDAVAKTVANWVAQLDKVVDASQQVEQKAKAAAKAAGTQIPDTVKVDPAKLAEAQARVEAMAAKQAELMAGVEGQWAPLMRGITEFSDGANGLSKNLNTLNESAKPIAIILTGIAAALATFTILSTIVPLVMSFAGAGTAIAAAFGVSGAGAALAAIVALLGGPVTIVIAAIALAVGLFTVAWLENWGDIQGKTEAVGEIVMKVLGAIHTFIDDPLMPIINKLATTVGTDLYNAFSATGEWIDKHVIPVLAAIATVLRDPVLPILATLIDVVRLSLIVGFQEWGRWITNTGTFFSDLGTAIDKWMASSGKAIDGWITSLIGQVPGLNGMLDNLRQMFDGIGKALAVPNDMLDRFFGFLSSSALASLSDFLRNLEGLRNLLNVQAATSTPTTQGAGPGQLSTRAGGGPASGWTMVGEQGPEIVNLPRGSNVIPNNQIGGAPQVPVAIYINGVGETVEQLARRVADIVEQRQGMGSRDRALGAGW